jgi:hypothetical protein
MSRRAGKDDSKSCKKNKQTTSSVCSHEAPAPATTKEGEPSHGATAGMELSEGFLGSPRVLAHGVTLLSQAREPKDGALQRHIASHASF